MTGERSVLEQKYEASASVVRRLPRYYRLLQELECIGQQRTSSRELGRQLGMTASQIRQDLSCFGCFGQQGSGYAVKELRENLERIMGLPQLLPAILVGAGSLGKVVSENVRFEERGFRLIGIFDIKPELIGKELAGIAISPLEQLEAFCAAHHPTAAVLCLPKESVQAAAERLVSLGIRGLWNFSHCDIAKVNSKEFLEAINERLAALMA